MLTVGTKSMFSCEVIIAFMPRKKVGGRTCGRVLCPGCRQYLAQELNASTVEMGGGGGGGKCLALCYVVAMWPHHE